jgi:hypothetical protein
MRREWSCGLGSAVAQALPNSLEHVSKIRLVSGHDFSRAEIGLKNKGF